MNQFCRISIAAALFGAVLVAGMATAEARTGQGHATLPTKIPPGWTGFVMPETSAPLRDLSPGQPVIYPNHTIFFNRLGGTYTYDGNPDSRRNINAISNGTLAPFSCGDDAWHVVMQCLKKGFGRFNVTITDVDPDTAPHTETVIAGSSASLGLPAQVAGIASMGCGQPWENGVSFAFAEASGCSATGLLDMCWTAAQETAHLFGLDHEISCQDFMTYDTACGFNKSFVDSSIHCGEYATQMGDFGPHQCTCDNASNQNSVSTLKAVFGSKGNTAPDFNSVRPSDGDVVQEGFAVDAVVYDDDCADANCTITSGTSAQVVLFIDNTMFTTLPQLPYHIVMPSDLSMGQHTIKLVATDAVGLTTEKSFKVNIKPPCTANDQCSGSDVCELRTGSCIAGPNEPGGIGAICTDAASCDSPNLCAAGPDNEMRCVAICTPGVATDCPDQFDCLAAGTSGACWPHPGTNPGGDDDGGGGGCGCAVGGTHDSGSRFGFGLGALGLAGLMFARRRGKK